MPRPLTMLPFLLFALSQAAKAQPSVNEPDGGGDYTQLISIKDEMTPAQRGQIISMLHQNENQLRRDGKLQTSLNVQATAFQWPLRQALGNNDNGFYGISYFVDENPNYPNAVRDYNCGSRSYDQTSGYNHQGTDIFTWPFYWQKMARNAVEVIAAAPGTIIGKMDGNYDRNCAFCTVTCDWNAIYIMHADGSVAWYGHLKSGSLTTKAVGQTVGTGEYLGVVGSSGNSTGPHLHFEVYINSTYTQLVDPWAGACNTLNGSTSWWASQQPYYVSTLNKIMIHGAPPTMTSCPTGDAPNEKINFISGQTFYAGSYFRDQLNGQQVLHTIYKPDNSVWETRTQTFTTWFSASWWYYAFTLPNPAPAGNWRYEVTYNGKKYSTWFTVNSGSLIICPSNIYPIFSNLSGSSYQWQVDAGSGFTSITDNTLYSGTNSNQLLLKNLPSSFYGYQYRCLVNGVNVSNTISLKFISYWTGSKSSSWTDPYNWSCGNIPDANTDIVIQNGALYYPEVNANTSCRSVSVTPGASLVVKPGMTLAIME